MPVTSFTGKSEKNMSYVIVLDPGHGGDQDGGTYGPYVEQNLNIAVAKAMKEYLDNFEGVTVYITRDSGQAMTIQERLDFAKSVNADYFISLHFNLSSFHTLYGSEVWIPAQQSYYNKMYPFADIVMQNFDDMGLFNRGIKTRIGKTGDNYYGVIRIGTNYGIPSCIIEHCHMDNSRDTFAIPSSQSALNASLVNFGIKDGEALAKFLKLKSTKLGLDYSSYKASTYKTKKSMVTPDETEPEVNEISLVSVDAAAGKVTINMHATDKDSYILYYMVSVDGGLTFAPLQDWPRTSWNKSLTDNVITIDVPANKELNIITGAVNSFDKIALSNVLNVKALSLTIDNKTVGENKTEDITVNSLVEDTADAISINTITYDDLVKETGTQQVQYTGSISLFCTSAVLLLVAMLFAYFRFFKKSGRKKKRYE